MRVWMLIPGLLLAACSGGTEPGAGDRLLVAAASDTLQVDSTVQLHAFIRSGDDSVDVPGAVWSSRNPDIASVDESGLVTGHASGIVTLVALSGNLRGSKKLRIERRFRARDVSTGSAGLCAVDLDGQVWCYAGWGTGVEFPHADASDIRTFTVPVSGDDRYTIVGSNRWFACGLTTSKHALCWGHNIIGYELPLALVPTDVAPTVLFDTLSVQSSDACGLSGGQARCWGFYDYEVEPIDLGGTPLVSLTVQESADCGWSDGQRLICWDAFNGASYDLPIKPPAGAPMLHDIVDAGDSACGLNAQGHAWCWGDNAFGQLGNATTTASAVAVEIAGGHQFTLLAASVDGYDHRVCGIAEDDVLFCWGAEFGAVPAAVLF